MINITKETIIRKEKDVIHTEVLVIKNDAHDFLPLWQEGEYTYGKGKWKVQNLLGIIAGEEMTISQAIYLDYKDDIQEGMPLVYYQGEKKDFIKLCNKLDIDVWEHPLCSECGKVIYGCWTSGLKGNLCFECELDLEEKEKIAT